MPIITKDKEYLLHKLEELPPELLQEVLDFVEFVSNAVCLQFVFKHVFSAACTKYASISD
jgi:hypothetical protein